MEASIEPVCPYCHVPAILVSSEEVYGTAQYGSMWICPNRQECDARVGCHRGTITPLGRLANTELRLAKIAAHAAFDPLWRSRAMTRNRAYSWLAGELGIDRRDCHIGRFDLETCRMVVQVCNRVAQVQDREVTGK